MLIYNFFILSLCTAIPYIEFEIFDANPNRVNIYGKVPIWFVSDSSNENFHFKSFKQKRLRELNGLIDHEIISNKLESSINPNQVSTGSFLDSHFNFETISTPISHQNSDSHLKIKEAKLGSVSEAHNQETVPEAKIPETVHENKIHETLPEAKIHNTVPETKIHETQQEAEIHETDQEGKLHETVQEGKKHETIEGENSIKFEEGSQEKKKPLNEVTNEDVIRRRKLEREKNGEVDYPDLPKELEETENGKNETHKGIKSKCLVFELLEGIAEFGKGLSIFLNLASEG